ncbi:MAG: hypothetical protein EBS56_08160, partial [Planctomycetia bacterium]|nr:hypothetical protein [Planctomycetia bacterium]
MSIRTSGTCRKAGQNPTWPCAARAPCPGHLLQRFERYELDGFDCLRGTLALVVPQGARAAHGHVGFCPAFRQVPEVRMDTPF